MNGDVDAAIEFLIAMAVREDTREEGSMRGERGDPHTNVCAGREAVPREGTSGDAAQQTNGAPAADHTAVQARSGSAVIDGEETAQQGACGDAGE